MTCERIDPLLVGFCLGLSTSDERAEVEAHLVECVACVRQFLSLKRDLETAADERPARAGTRAKIRGAVAQELGLAPPSARRWWERPMAVAFATAAVWASIFTVHALAVGPGKAPYALGEGARSGPR